MSCPIIEPAEGTVDGANKLFRSSKNYVTTTIQVFLNGVLAQRDLLDGWIELGSKKIQLNEAPKTGDIVQLYYIPT